jgi:hypothetical protein
MMARMEVGMNEIVEKIYRLHQGVAFKSICGSLGFDRKTLRKYVDLAQTAGESRGILFPEESEPIAKPKEATSSCLLREPSAQDILSPYQE